jgi:hypothetical protein
VARKAKVTATVLDSEGYPHVVFRGNPQNVGDALSIYMQNVSNPLGGLPAILNDGVDFIERRETEGD